jgi:cob(I)alamin adenosyltransferase
MPEASPSPEEQDARHAAKMRKKQAARDTILASKTREQGLLIVHTGKGKGKTSAALGMVVRAIGHGMKVGVVQFVKGAMHTGEKAVFEAFPSRSRSSRWGRVSPGTPRTAAPTSPPPAPRGRKSSA